MTPRKLSLFSLVLMGLFPAQAQITVDGSRDAAYGQPLAIQLAPTGFGDNTDATPLTANGSELNAAYAVIRADKLHLFLAGNLETNFNKLEVFIDSQAGGQNVLAGDNPDVDLDGLNAMAGLTFDSDFAPDHYFTMGGGDQGFGAGLEFFVSFATLGTTGFGAGTGSVTSFPATMILPAATTGLGLDRAIRVGLDNSNTSGITNASVAGASTVSTGIEISIPLDLLGGGTQPVKICAFINNGNHTFLSNQVLGSLPAATSNLGGPGTVNFESEPSGTDQFFIVTADIKAGVEATLDAGGGRTTAGIVVNDGAIGGIVGISGDTTVARHGFVGQIYDAVALELGASPAQVDEGQTRQLTAVEVMDDQTTLALDPAEVEWVNNSDALTSISAAGLATAGTVFQDSLANVGGTRAGLADPDGFDLTVINVGEDDFGSYAADGIDDDWQVDFFGIGNPEAAPGENPDGDRDDNLMEFLAGFDPTDASQFFQFKIEGFSNPGTLDLKLNKVIPGRVYHLLESGNLTAPFAEVSSFSVTTEELEKIIQDGDAPADRNFYRIEISKP